MIVGANKQRLLKCYPELVVIVITLEPNTTSIHRPLTKPCLGLIVVRGSDYQS